METNIHEYPNERKKNIIRKTKLFVAACFLTMGLKAQIITTIAGNGTASYEGDGGQAINAEFYSPSSVALDNKGNIYIVDTRNYCIRKVNTLGVISTIAGMATGGYSGDGGPATAAELSPGFGLVTDIHGNLFFSDKSNNRVRKVNAAGIISTFAGNGVGAYSGDGGQATAAKLNNMDGLIFDVAGNLYIADTDNHRIRKVNTAGVISTIAGNGTAGYSGDGGAATASKLYFPEDITFDAAGNLYIADTYNNVVRKINSLGIISTIAGNGFNAGTGNGGYSGNGGQATAAELNYPEGIAFDNEGSLYISDFNNSAIRKVATSGIICTISGNGTYGYSGDGGQAFNAELNSPTDVVFDTNGNLYIADEGNNRIRMVTNVLSIGSCASTTGIEQIKSSNVQLNIYPNPSTGSFTIETNSDSKQTLTMYDVTGKIILSQTINGKTIIDASSLNEGIYNISIIRNEGVVNKKMVIIR